MCAQNVFALVLYIYLFVYVKYSHVNRGAITFPYLFVILLSNVCLQLNLLKCNQTIFFNMLARMGGWRLWPRRCDDKPSARDLALRSARLFRGRERKRWSEIEQLNERDGRKWIDWWKHFRLAFFS